MKQGFLALSLILLFIRPVLAKDKYTPGYLVSKNGDTLLCRIGIPYNFGKFNELDLFSSVTVLDSSNKKLKLKPADIAGYGFMYESKKYIFVSKTVDDDNQMVFVKPVILGRRVNEYYYYTYNSSDLAKGSMGAVSEIYVLEDDSKQTVSITRGGSLVNTYKSQLRKFFENDKRLLQLIEQEVKSFRDISKFVQQANSLPR